MIPKKENTENPCFGGNEWLGFGHREWAEQNCKADWETAFPDPGSVSGTFFNSEYGCFMPRLMKSYMWSDSGVHFVNYD